MPYLIFTANGEEFDRRELDGPAVLGRAPDCNITIPDIMLSRHHCRVEPTEARGGWRIIDLHSKNGTHLRGRALEMYVLRDADELRIGRTRLTFMAGDYVPPPSHTRRRGVIRPSDPAEALAGTMVGITLCEPGEVEKSESFPYPQPRPADPNAYANEALYDMISQIASSSWDSIMAQNSEPIRMQRVMPVAMPARSPRGGVRPKARVAFCLQAEHRESIASSANALPASRTRTRRPRRWMIATGLGSTAAFIVLWVSLILSASNTDSGPAPSPSRVLPRSQETPAAEGVEPIRWDAVAVAA